MKKLTLKAKATIIVHFIIYLIWFIFFALSLLYHREWNYIYITSNNISSFYFLLTLVMMLISFILAVLLSNMIALILCYIFIDIEVFIFAIIDNKLGPTMIIIFTGSILFLIVVIIGYIREYKKEKKNNFTADETSI